MKRRICSLVVLALITFSTGAADRTAAHNAFAGDHSGPDIPSHPQTYPPGILFGTLLDNISVNANGGWIKIGTNMVSVFMPDGSSGRMVLSNSGGSEICHWEWQSNRGRFNAPFQSIYFRNASAPGGGQFDATKLKMAKAGSYVFDFFIEGKKFYTFPVSIREVKPGNPFGGDPRYLVEGDWNRWGYVHIADAAPEGNVAWKLWVREWEYDLKQRSIVVELVNDAGRKLVAENRVRTNVTFRHDWERLDFQMFKPGDKSLFKGKDLADGSYTLTMKMNGAVYGVWKFKVSGGKPVQVGRAERGKASPETFVEGGIDAFWFEMEAK